VFTIIFREHWPRPIFFQSFTDANNDTSRFGKLLFEALERTDPVIPPLELSSNAEALVFWKANHDTPRPDLVAMSSDKVSAMRDAHNTYREEVRKLDLPYQKNTHGIVSTAGGSYLPMFIVSLRMLRRTGCTLPVELILVSEE